MLLAFIVTFLAIHYQDAILSRNLVFTPADTSTYAMSAYSDMVYPGGATTIAASGDRPLEFSCEIRPGHQWPFCAYELVFEKSSLPSFNLLTGPLSVVPKPGNGRGLDLSSLESLEVDFTYEGAAETVRFQLKNEDPRYSIHGVRETSKINETEFMLTKGRQTIVARAQDFSVATWWKAGRKLTPDLSLTQFDNVVSLEILTGQGAQPGPYRFQVHSVTLKQSALTQAQWYLLILAVWAVGILVLLVIRVISLKRDFEKRHARQAWEARLLENAKQAAEAANKAKSDFLANMSHELRTPLNAIIGYAQLLKRRDFDDQRDRIAAETIHSSGNHLLALITDLLDLAKIEAKKLDLDKASMDLAACVRGVADIMTVPAQQKGLELVCILPPDLPRFVVGDEKRIRQVLINLVGNAVKFTKEGKVELALSLLSPPGESAALRFEVRDTGCGIEQEQLAIIFEAFEQLGDAEGKAAGTGLGLSISRRLVALMNSRIEVESRFGEGTRFWFDLVLDICEDDIALPASKGRETTDDARGDTEAPRGAKSRLVAPPQEEIDRLLELALAGNMRAIRAQADHIAGLDERYSAFADELRSLASTYQSPAILRLIEEHVPGSRKAA